MDIFNPNFLLIFLAAVLIITLRARSKKRDRQVLPGKQVAIIGRKLETPLSVDTPYACLLADGNKYGDGFQVKEEPELPHTEGCQCRLSSCVQRNYDIFTKTPSPETPHTSDLGELARSEARFYKYMLIAHHRDADENDRISYAELAEQADVTPEFRNRVREHLGLY